MDNGEENLIRPKRVGLKIHAIFFMCKNMICLVAYDNVLKDFDFDLFVEEIFAYRNDLVVRTGSHGLPIPLMLASPNMKAKSHLLSLMEPLKYN